MSELARCFDCDRAVPIEETVRREVKTGYVQTRTTSVDYGFQNPRMGMASSEIFTLERICFECGWRRYNATAASNARWQFAAKATAIIGFGSLALLSIAALIGGR